MNEFYDYEAEDETEYYAVRPNKTDEKRETVKLHAIALELSELSESQLKIMTLEESLTKAVSSVIGMPLKSARKRQLKFIVGLLRKADSEQVEEGLSRIKSRSALAVKELHLVEYWRDYLIADENKLALTELLNKYPQADSQYLRQLIRNARKEATKQLSPKSTRLLYQYLKDLMNIIKND